MAATGFSQRSVRPLPERSSAGRSPAWSRPPVAAALARLHGWPAGSAVVCRLIFFLPASVSKAKSWAARGYYKPALIQPPHGLHPSRHSLFTVQSQGTSRKGVVGWKARRRQGAGSRPRLSARKEHLMRKSLLFLTAMAFVASAAFASLASGADHRESPVTTATLPQTSTTSTTSSVPRTRLTWSWR